MEKRESCPRVSVIMPAYNMERYLEDAVESVLCQTYRDFELIIIDDGSTDSTPAIARRLAERDERIRVLTRRNGGLSAARNTGLDAARGEVLFFLDSDDMFHPMALEKILGIYDDEEADVVTGSAYIGETLPRCWMGEIPERGEMERYDSAEAIKAGLYQKHMLNSVAMMCVSRSIFDGESRLRFTENLCYEDLDIFYRIYAAAGKVVWTPMQFYFYRQTPGSITHTLNVARFDVLKVTAKIEAAMARSFPELAGAASDRRFSACFNIFTLISSSGRGEYEDVAAECWREIKSRRWRSLTDPEVRLKNKAGALLSYLGKRATAVISRCLLKF